MTAAAALRLLTPTRAHLPAYADALRRGWTPDTTRPHLAAADAHRIEDDPDGFLASLDHRDPTGSITLPNGNQAPRLPGFRLLLWDGDFCGTIGLRWQPGTPDLPPHCLGHIGYTVVPWKRHRGYATTALAHMLPHARALGLPHVDLVTAPDNGGSQRVITANGGHLIEKFTTTVGWANGTAYRYRIPLADTVTP